MTTTMANRPAAKVRHAPLALLALALSPSAMAEWKFTPTVDLRASYSDNVNLIYNKTREFPGTETYDYHYG